MPALNPQIIKLEISSGKITGKSQGIYIYIKQQISVVWIKEEEKFIFNKMKMKTAIKIHGRQ